jgi:hypothetical protein
LSKVSFSVGLIVNGAGNRSLSQVLWKFRVVFSMKLCLYVFKTVLC